LDRFERLLLDELAPIKVAPTTDVIVIKCIHTGDISAYHAFDQATRGRNVLFDSFIRHLLQ